MVYAEAAWAQAPYGGAVLPPTPTGDLPPPIPGDSMSFRYTFALRANPWASLSWAGGYPPLAYPGGGVYAKPDPERGVVAVSAWWPDATAIHLVRVTPDGVRTPVRGAYPLTTTAPTRRNLCTNPSFEAGLNGVIPADGNPTLFRMTPPPPGVVPERTAYLRAYLAAMGTIGVTLPTGFSGAAIATPVTVGAAIRLGGTPTNCVLQVLWQDSGGGSLGTNGTPLDANERAAVVGQFIRVVKQIVVPAGAVNGTLKVIALGMPANQTLDIDAVTLELGTTSGSYFDGATFGGAWVGTPELSTSALPPVLTIDDAECPLDTIVTYEAYPIGLRGGYVASDPLTLNSVGHAWLTHPPGPPVTIDLRTVPTLEAGIEQGVFWPIGSRRAIAVSAPRRAPGGELEINTYSFAERDAFRDLFSDGGPVLLRCPAEYGWPAAWLAVGTTTEDRGDRKAYHDYTLITAPFVEVNAPTVLA